MKIGLVSLGCPKNLVDSEIMLGILQKEGHTITNNESEASVLIVNTCAFIDEAKDESIKTILELAHHKVTGSCRVLLAAGCLAQRFPRELSEEMPEIDGLLGTGAVVDVAEMVKEALSGERKINTGGGLGYLPKAGTPRVVSTPKYTAYLKIAEGCDNRCSYCVIPHVRGPYRSRSLEDLADEGAMLTAHGAKEIILVAQDTTRYGTDLYNRTALPDLLKRLAALEGAYWLRLMYTYPALLNDDLIELMAAEKKVVPYIDLPLQHASDRILARMNRRGSSAQILKLMEKIRKTVPGVTLRTSFITGFPGETEEEFQELLDFIREARFDRVGVFAYSREENTPAAAMPDQIPDRIKSERRDQAMAVQQEISLEKNKGKIGKKITVLMEGAYEGRSEGDAPEIDGKVYVNNDREILPGEFVSVLITGATEYDLTGDLQE